MAHHSGMQRLTNILGGVLLSFALIPAASAIDPPYQAEMARLAEIMGSLSFLQPLCGNTTEDWRAQMADLIALDEPDEDRRQRLTGAFNEGFTGFARTYRVCTPAAHQAISRLLTEADQTVRDLHSRYAE
jgi:uncharacterized protein (TIGR02301 family)